LARPRPGRRRPDRPLTRKASSEAIRRATESPPPGLLTVVDPRLLTADAAAVANRHGLNALAAELLAAALAHRSPVLL